MLKKSFVYIILLIISCKEVYNPTLKNVNPSYLVVEGNIVANDDSTFMYLSRTVKITDSIVVNNPETNAVVKVESEDGESYQLQNEFNGTYVAPPLNVDLSKNYRVHIFTADGREYASDYVPVKTTPAIDSISWKKNDEQLTIYANTHDATNSTQYYRWKYVATWEYHAKQNSELIYDPAINWIRPRTPEEEAFRCWKTDISNDIIISSTTNLSSDVVFERPLVSIPYGSQQLMTVYSVIVTQYALSKDAYEFWQNLKKNTEQVGSIFDPQPFADYGNIHCINDPAEPVVGFISACSIQQQRIYIYWSQVQWPYPYPNCKDTIITEDKIQEIFSHDRYMPVHSILSPPGAILGDFKECVDCRLQGGLNVKPSYMP